MEIFLLIVIIGLLVYLKTNSDHKQHDIESQFRELRRSLEELKSHVKPGDPLPGKEAAKPEAVPPPVARPTATPVTERVYRPAFDPVKPTETPQEPAIRFSAPPLNPTPAKPATSPAERPQPVPKVYEKSFWEKFKEQNPDLEKFIGENLINKLGVLILVLGISYFVKYAIDKDWINEPARVGIGILAGGIVMGVAHRLRKNFAAFSSVLVAGAVAIFYFTIGIAFHDYHLFGQSVAFGIMVVITAFSALISLSYNRMELAILTLIGGFAVPFMVSTGEGNYIVLFTYILILDLGILIIAYFKRWQLLNILAFAFTAILYGAWLYGEMLIEAPHFAGAFAFAIAFYFAFTVINLVNTVRRKAAFNGTELSLMVTNTFLFYAAGSLILTQWHPGLRGLFTAGLALLNLVYAIILFRKFGVDKVAVYLLIGLTLTFITLAVPVQFEGNNITLFWSAEMVLLMWLGQKSGLVPYRFAAVALLLLSLSSLLIDWVKYYLMFTATENAAVFINPVAITGLFSTACLAGTWFVLRKDGEATFEWKSYRFNSAALSKVILVLSILTAYLTGLWEINQQASYRLEWQDTASAVTALYHLVFSTALCFFLFNKKRWQLLSLITAANIVLFTFWFSSFAFNEIQDTLITGKEIRLALYCHYADFILIACCGYFLYKASKEETAVFKNTRFLLWAGGFFIVYILSTEVILHGILFNISEITMDAVKARTGYSPQFYADKEISALGWQISKTALPVLWGLLAFGFLIIGIRRKSKELRIIALALLGLTIAKLFLYDIRNASETGKIIAFILLGVLILVISFVYQKIRLLVIEDPKKEEDEKTV